MRTGKLRPTHRSLQPEGGPEAGNKPDQTAPIRIYTDGSCSPNPGPGGWAAVLLFPGGKTVELSGSITRATNNRMELLAALSALQSLKESGTVEIFTDSRYLHDGICGWLDNWRRNGWQTLAGVSVKNRDLWEELAVQLNRHRVAWTWVRGHAQDLWNERADVLAVAARKRIGETTAVMDPGAVHLFPAVTWKNSSGAGAWSVILSYGGHVRVIGGRQEATTANRLQLLAVIAAVRRLKRRLPVVIHSRSGYLRDGLERWVLTWERRGWRRGDGAEVGNGDEWRELARLKRTFSLRVCGYAQEEPPCFAQEAKEIAREYEQLQSG